MKLGLLRPPLRRTTPGSGRTRSTARSATAAASTASSTRAPRTLGGCTAHNAMILMYPHNRTGTASPRLTGDRSWRAAAMRRHFVSLENCRHRPVVSAGSRSWASIRRGTAGAAGCATERADPHDRVLRFRADALHPGLALELSKASGTRWQRLRWFVESQADPNDWRLVERRRHVGVRYLPLATHGRRRRAGRASECWTWRSGSPTACASSSTRSRRACCSTATSAPSASST